VKDTPACAGASLQLVHCARSSDRDNRERLPFDINGSVLLECLDVNHANHTTARVGHRDMVAGNGKAWPRVAPMAILAIGFGNR